AEKDIIQKAKDCSIRIYGMSDYEIAPSGQSTVGKLLLGYATLTTEEIKKAMEILKTGVFIECNL
ncbi:MAG: hypothetical protein PHS82_12600, partial [Lachnospiraceae bacterium]|nr:hypothetical protein [Lachnospiraceae bacterium]